jgi:hypothetical protein
MADNLSTISEAMRKASEAFADAMGTVSKSIQGAASKSDIPERDRMVENWLRFARMSKDGIITAIEQGFEAWEREARRIAGAGGTSKASANPMDAWAENMRKATEAFMGGGTSSFAEEARKQAESVQKSMTEGFRAWQRLWEPKS